MTDSNRSVTMKVPITMNIGPVPEGMDSHSQLFTFALGHIKKILADKGIVAQVDGEHAIAGYASNGATAYYTALGAKLDDRHYRIAPEEGGEGHDLQISLDGGKTFTSVAVFNGDYDFVDGLGRSWAEGQAEKKA